MKSKNYGEKFHRDKHQFKTLANAQIAENQRIGEHIFKISSTYFVGTLEQYLKRISE